MFTNAATALSVSVLLVWVVEQAQDKSRTCGRHAFRGKSPIGRSMKKKTLLEDEHADNDGLHRVLRFAWTCQTARCTNPRLRGREPRQRASTGTHGGCEGYARCPGGKAAFRDCDCGHYEQGATRVGPSTRRGPRTRSLAGWGNSRGDRDVFWMWRAWMLSRRDRARRLVGLRAEMDASDDFCAKKIVRSA